MRLRGNRFAFDADETWHVQLHGETVIASDISMNGRFAPTIVLRESRLARTGPEMLATIAQANIAAVPRGLPGGVVIHVEAIPDPAASPGPRERRRLWVMAPAELPNERTVSLLIVQDLLITGDAVAELTATVPLWNWADENPFLDALNSLAPLPPRERGTPSTVSSLPPGLMDEWATRRDGAPREHLSVQERVPLMFAGQNIEIPAASFHALMRLHEEWELNPDSLSPQPLIDPLSADGAALRQAGLTNTTGQLNDHALSLTRMMRQGSPWCVDCTSLPDRELLGWTNGFEALIAASPAPDEPDDAPYRVGTCSAEDLTRIILHWTGTMPGWHMDFRLPPLSPQLVEAKCRGTAQPELPGLSPDAAAFTHEPWRRFLLRDGRSTAGLDWIATPTRGAARIEPGAHGELEVTGPAAQPLWSWLSGTALAMTLMEAS